MNGEIESKKSKEISSKLKYFLEHVFKAYFDIETKKRIISEVNKEISLLENGLKKIKRKPYSDLAKVEELEGKISHLKSRIKKLNKKV